ncbi:MAG: capsule assembly Wzi family protein [Bacteroidaceae bacterium]
MKSLLILACSLPLCAFPQASRLAEDVSYGATITGVACKGTHSPFFLSNNKYGLGTPENNFGYLRTYIGREAEADSLRNWKIGYGADIVVSANLESSFILQQLYADLQWKNLRLSIGQKERPPELKNLHLSSGAMTTGINTRPLPQVRLEIPDFVDIRCTKGWLAFKGHLSFGWYTDGKWQKEFNNGNIWSPYTRHSKYHSKALYLRIGNEAKFPLTLSGGLEMCCQFGGEAWNLRDRADHDDPNFSSHQDLNDGWKNYWQALTFSGEDVNDGDYMNVAGNHLGSWHARLDYKGKGWSSAFYLEHFFEDHSQLFWQYGWRDMLYGVEINLPRNKFVSTIVYEHIGTMDQSGPIYHDKSENMNFQISGIDGYYNNHIYGAWQHAGFVMGNPLLISPIYNQNGVLRVLHNRIRAHHIGISGNPLQGLSWRFVISTEKSYGTYDDPLIDPLRGTYFLTEATYRPKFARGLGITLSYAHDGGKLLGNSNGAMLSISYTVKTARKENR